VDRKWVGFKGVEEMDRTQAAEIQRHMLRAAKAINRASEIVFALDEEGRQVLGTPLLEIIDALHFKLLRAVYIRYPELRPPDPGRSRVNTARRWKDIVLPESVSETDLDNAIFSALTSRWQKTAVVVGNALKYCKTLALPVDEEMVGVRIRALAEAGRLEGEGDLRKWRYSEVRLNAGERRDV
jgi:uncharacterized protein DUF3658